MKKLTFAFAILSVSVLTATAQLPDIISIDLPEGPNGMTLPKTNERAQSILDHPVRLKNRRLQPWTSYDTIMAQSMNYLKNCPTHETPVGTLPYYLITSKLNEDASFRYNQNNQGGNLYFAWETYKRYYAYTGDKGAFVPVKLLAEQIAKYMTPADYAWPNMPRTQDDTPDGVYDDEKGETDKACMVAVAFMEYARYTGETRYFQLAEGIAKTLLSHVKEGGELESPLPYRVNMKTGAIIDPYTSDMIMAVKMIDELLAQGTTLNVNELKAKQQTIMDWILKYPMQNFLWSGYFEDVATLNHTNVNQAIPLETARYLIQHPEHDPLYKEHIKKLIYFVKYRFGFIRRYGATSIMEQDGCFYEMSSHTARYASVVARWFGMTGNEAAREEARASFALASYSACNRFTKDGMGINATGIGYALPWYSDSYFDYMSHYFEGFEEIPEMIPEGTNHLFYTSSMITDIQYQDKSIKYTALDQDGTERVKLTYTPVVYANGKPLPKSQWHYGKYKGIPGILTIKRKNTQTIEIREK